MSDIEGYKKFAEKYDLELCDDRYFYSEEWSLGGTYGSWNGNKGIISPGRQPSTFVTFDKLLTEVWPDIGFLQYKILCAECVTIENREQGDYYGGSEHKAYYCCDCEKLYEWLVSNNLFNPEMLIEW
jgi:hypothetical protein